VAGVVVEGREAGVLQLAAPSTAAVTRDVPGLKQRMDPYC
jgi:hypothetical protein